MADKQIRTYDHNWGWIGAQTNASGKSNGYNKSLAHSSAYLADTPELYEIQRRNNFELYIKFNEKNGNGDSDYKITGDATSLRKWNADTSTTLSKDKNYIPDASKRLRLSVSSCTVPNFTQDVIKIRRGNNEMKFAGVPTWGDGTIVCNDYIGAGTYDILVSWQAMAYNQTTERVGLVQDYKRSGVLFEYTPDYQEVRRWTIHGMWLSGLSSDSFDYESNGKMTVSATFQYDYAVLSSGSESYADTYLS